MIVIKKIFSVFLLTILLSIFIRVFVGEPCSVSNNSMESTIMDGDWLWIDKTTYGAVLPNRWSNIPLVNILTWVPGFQERDMSNNWKYRRMKGFAHPQINDIVVFKSLEDMDLLLIKRVSEILHAGSLIHIDTINFVLYNDIISQEVRAEVPNNRIINKSYQLKNSYYFLLGDNPDTSRDSRSFGYVSERNIVGKANRVLFSTGKEKNRFFKKLE